MADLRHVHDSSIFVDAEQDAVNMRFVPVEQVPQVWSLRSDRTHRAGWNSRLKMSASCPRNHLAAAKDDSALIDP
jgi:hypothetical protein